MTRLKFVMLPLLLLGIVAMMSPVSAAEPPAQYAAVLSVNRMCCAKESVPAIKELSKVPGVGRVAVDYKNRTLSIQATETAPSPRAIWEAAERVKVEPTRLAMRSTVYTSKPAQ